MDKYEYKIRSEEIKELIAKGEYAEAVEIADTIDWRRVKSAMMLCTISDLYKINRRYEDAKEILLLAYDKRPNSKNICYSLCELCLKTEDFANAYYYYKEFTQVAPKDAGRFVLLYKLYEAQEVSLEERIGVLEELKKRDYREKWAYELAYLYHRVGLGTKCVEECDELILWFGEGKYVIKAMELKMLHQPLSASQQEKYDHRFDAYGAVADPVYEEPVADEQQAYEMGAESAPTGEIPVDELPAEEYPTEEIPTQELPVDEVYAEEYPVDGEYEGSYEGEYPSEEYYPEEGESDPEEAGTTYEEDEDEEFHVKTVDVSEFNTINLQAAIAEGLAEVLGQDTTEIDQETLDNMLAGQYPESPLPENEVTQETTVWTPAGDEGAYPAEEDIPYVLEEVDGDGIVEEVPDGETTIWAPVEEVVDYPVDDATKVYVSPLAGYDTQRIGDIQATIEEVLAGSDVEELPVENEPVSSEVAFATETDLSEVSAQIDELLGAKKASYAEPPKQMADVLSQEADGQISLVMPEKEAIEEQITGQIDFNDYLLEWERAKQAKKQEWQDGVKQRILEHTGPMFTEFEAAIRDGLLEQIEAAGADAEFELPEEQEEAVEYTDDQDQYTDENGEYYEDAEDYGEVEEIEEILDSEELDSLEAVPVEEIVEENFEELEETEEEVVEEPEELEEAEEEIAEEPEEFEEAEEEIVEEPEEFEEAEEEIVEEPEEFEEAEEEVAEESEEFEEAEEEIVEESEESEELEEAEEEIAEESENLEETEEETAEEPVEESEEPEATKEVSQETADISGVVAEVLKEDEAQAKEKAEEKKAQAEAEQKIEGKKPAKAKIRQLTKEEKELYGSFLESRHAKEKLVKALDNVSMAPYTGNIIITGDEEADTFDLAKNMIREIRSTDSNFSGKVAKITGESLNDRDIEETIQGVANGALLIEGAGALKAETIAKLYKSLQHDHFGVIVCLLDKKNAIVRMFKTHPQLKDCFNSRINIDAMSNDALVAYGKKYAREREYSIDDLGMLEFHTRVEERQTNQHAVTVAEVREIIDAAIKHANKKSVGHLMDILFAKRYDEEDMIILTAKDFEAV